MLSVAAAIPHRARSSARIAATVPVVRAMPNAPSIVHEGIAGICAGAHAGDEHLALAEECLSHLGAVVRVPEPYMDAVTAVSGSGPAYFALLAEAMIEAGLLLGLSREVTTQLVVQTMLGTAKLLRDEHMHPVELREAVTSPGGTTIARSASSSGRGARGVPERDPGSDGALAGTGRRGQLSTVDFRAVDTADAAAEEAAALIAEAVDAGGHIGLSGGSGPRPAYERAGVLQPDWGKVELWWIDERCVPPADGRSNYRTIRESLLDGLSRTPEVHRIQGELTPEAAADEYDAALDGVTLDLAVMGIGPDGHTASLFPNAPALDETQRRAVAAEAGMEPFVPRVTMTRPVLAAARTMLVPRHRREQGRSGEAGVRRRAVTRHPCQPRPRTDDDRPARPRCSRSLGVVAPLRLHRRSEVTQPLELFRARLPETLGVLATPALAPVLPPLLEAHGNRSDVRSAAMSRRAASACSTSTVSATGTSSR